MIFFRLLVILSLAVSFTADAGEGDKERLSGVVTPKISTLQPYIASQNPDIEEYVIPTKYSSPFGVAIDSKDRIWFTETAGNSLAVLDPATNQLKEYRIPSTVGLEEVEWKYDPKKRSTPEKAINVYTVGSPGNIIIARDGTVWFVMQLGNSVVRFDPSKEEFTEFTVPTENALPYDLSEDSKGRIWFIEKNAGKLSYLDFEKKSVVEIKFEKGTSLMSIAIDGDDNIWVGETANNYIGRYNPNTKKLRKFRIDTPQSQPGIMKFDKEGKLWFCQLRTKQIGVLFPDPGVFSVANMPGFNAVAQALAPADDDKIWFVDSMMNRIGFFDAVSLDWKIFSIPTPNSQPMDIEIDSRGDIWFSQSDRKANKIARLIRSTVPEAEALSGGSAGAYGDGKGGQVEAKHAPRLKPSAGFIITAAVVIVLVVLGLLLVRRKRPH